MNKKKLFAIGGVLLVAIALIAGFLLRGKGEEKPEEAPEEEPLPEVEAPQLYETETDSVLALPVGKGVVVTLEEAEEPEEEETEEEPKEETENEEEAEAEDHTEEVKTEPLKAEAKDPKEGIKTGDIYHYSGMTAPSSTVSAYAQILTGADFGFSVYDEAMKKTELPEFTDSGSLLMVHTEAKAEEGEEAAEEAPAELMGLELSWTAENCDVQLCQVPKDLVAVKKMPRPEPMSITEIVDYFYAVPPAKLGLEGESMRDYHVMPIDGTALVEGVPCLQMNIYGSDPDTGTHFIAGQYLFSNEDRSLYEIVDTGKVEKITL